jgi:ribose 5-phosphate isomerase RpiB
MIDDENAGTSLLQSIKNELKEKNLKLIDYKAGLAEDKYGRKVKISKYISKDLQKDFISDPARTGKGKNKFKVVISRHPYDIAGMSTDRGWTSCMNLNDGMYKEKVKEDIKEGTLVAYLIKDDDTNITKPISRVLIKPLKNKNGNVYLEPENKIYGQNILELKDIVSKWTLEINKDKYGIFNLPKNLYSDNIKEKIMIFKDMNNLTNKEIEDILDELKIKNYTIYKDGTVDVNGDVYLTSLGLTKIPVKFGKVTGNFNCSNNQLTSLKNAPKEVTGYFDCSCNKLTSLKNAPEKVGRSFDCSFNNLTTLEYAPKEVNGYFNCSYNKVDLDYESYKKSLINKEVKDKIYALKVPEIIDHYMKDKVNALDNINSYISSIKDPKINKANLLQAKKIIKGKV